ncbi:hypothetical protein J6590_083340 [Homalodisca vitripennis]|nr:hypothetical protein J6590_083340 [Homalodisca vitripennis]
MAQLKFQKEQAELSLQLLESEAEETINSLQNEVKTLAEKNKFYEEEVKSRDEQITNKNKEISILKNQLYVEHVEVNVEHPPSDRVCKAIQSSNESKPNNMQIKLLENKVNELRKENLKLIEAIQPCPLPDETLTKEIKRLNEHVELLEHTFTEELQSYREIIDLKLLTKDFTKDDSVIIIGGTNDDIVDKEDKLINIFKDIIQLTTHTTVRIAAIPCRHDVPGLNNRIAYINMELEKILSQHLDADFLPVNILPRHMYTKKRDSLQPYRKKELSKMIKHSICGETKINTDNLRTQIHEEKLNLSMNSVTGIQVLEGDMGEIIENLKSNESCAFAHTISGDFHQDRRMTAGVAVVFAKQFGKPVWRDCLTKHLAYQRDGPRAAGVYSLITKDNFNDKPSRDDYNKAFHDLTHDFKSRTFSTLICSPLGCVRDHVKIEHFAKNINEFHQTTGAKVVVVTKEQSTARRVLHHGLSHAVFVRKLKEEIKKAGSADTPVTKDLGTSQSVPVSTQSSFNLNSFHLHCSDFPPLTVPTKSLQAPLTPGKNPSSCLNSLVPQQTPPC